MLPRLWPVICSSNGPRAHGHSKGWLSVSHPRKGSRLWPPVQNPLPMATLNAGHHFSLYMWFTQHQECQPSFFSSICRDDGQDDHQLQQWGRQRACVLMTLQPLFSAADYHYSLIYTPDFLPLSHKSMADISLLTGCAIYSSRLFWWELWKWRTDVCNLSDMMERVFLLLVYSNLKLIKDPYLARSPWIHCIGGIPTALWVSWQATHKWSHPSWRPSQMSVRAANPPDICSSSI